MRETNEQQNVDWKGIANVDPLYAESLRSRQDDESIRNLSVLMELQPKRTVWVLLRSILSRQ